MVRFLGHCSSNTCRFFRCCHATFTRGVWIVLANSSGVGAVFMEEQQGVSNGFFLSSPPINDIGQSFLIVNYFQMFFVWFIYCYYLFLIILLDYSTLLDPIKLMIRVFDFSSFFKTLQSLEHSLFYVKK